MYSYSSSPSSGANKRLLEKSISFSHGSSSSNTVEFIHSNSHVWWCFIGMQLVAIFRLIKIEAKRERHGAGVARLPCGSVGVAGATRTHTRTSCCEMTTTMTETSKQLLYL